MINHYQEMERLFHQIPNLGLVAEDGAFIRHPGKRWQSLIKESDIAWRDSVYELFNYYTERTPGSFVRI